MRISEVATDDDAGVRAVYAVRTAALLADSPHDPPLAFEEWLPRVSEQPDVSRTELLLARDGDRAVGAAELRLPLRDNLENATLSVHVDPSARRLGHGRALLERATAAARAAGRRTVVAEVAEPIDGSGSAGVAFAEAAGARRALTETHRVLALDTVSTERLAALETEARASSAGYSLVQWTSPTPEEHVHGYAALIGAMTTDAPLDELDWEPEAWDAARIRDREDVIARQGRLVLVTAARQDSSGRLVAFSEVAGTRHDPANGFQWDTLVHRSHRGRRLGLLTKVANLALLRRELPMVRRVHTWNADSNRHMVAINEVMGFRPVSRVAEWQLTLSA